MNVVYQFIYFYLLFETNYYFISTLFPKYAQMIPREKRTTNTKSCIIVSLNFSKHNYQICIKKRSIVHTGVVDNDTKFVLYKNKTKHEYGLHDINIKYLKGYIVSKPYSSSFRGYIKNNRWYGTMEIDLKTYYIEPLQKFPFLNVNNEVTDNAVMYETGLNSDNTLYNQSSNNTSRRTKRGVDDVKNQLSGKVCSLLILIDASFLNIVSQGNIKLAVVTVLHSLDLANSIFRITDFDDDGIPDNVGFMVKYVVVLESEDIGINLLPPYTIKSIDGRLYLYYLSQYELLREVCLGIAFTAQSFLHRALGLSYTAIIQVPNMTIPNSGGICERPSRIDFWECFNNLVITYRLEKQEIVPQITSDLSLAHELGHSFGSDHDTKGECYGYLMSPHTFNGTYGHNYMFSSCSKKQINEVLTRKKYCLQTSNKPFCGNGLVEKNEDCDCGYPFNCKLSDPCCIARNTKGPSCKVNKKAGYECHPSQGLCCLSNCRYRDISSLQMTCNNFDKKCPCEGQHKKCSCGILGRCINNSCHSYECARIGLKECKCKSQKKAQKCITCCLSLDEKCLPSKKHTQLAITEDKEYINYLKRYSPKTEDVNDKGTKTYKHFCDKNKCIYLSFREFKEGSFCLFKGQLGICQPNFECIISSIQKSVLPTFKKVVSDSSNCIHNACPCIIFFILLCSNIRL